jgi:hypothetical protein
VACVGNVIIGCPQTAHRYPINANHRIRNDIYLAAYPDRLTIKGHGYGTSEREIFNRAANYRDLAYLARKRSPVAGHPYGFSVKGHASGIIDTNRIPIRIY